MIIQNMAHFTVYGIVFLPVFPDCLLDADEYIVSRLMLYFPIFVQQIIKLPQLVLVVCSLFFILDTVE